MSDTARPEPGQDSSGARFRIHAVKGTTARMARPLVGTRSALYDSLFLAAVVVLSCLPYMGGLGLYSDDWGLVSSLHQADGSYRSLLASIMMAMQTRPLQAHLLAGLYQLFGLDILGYHAVNCAMLTAAVLLFYHSLRTLHLPRVLVLTVPLIFGLLPHYSTDRYWIAAFQATACILLYFLSLYADLRFVREPRVWRWAWKALGGLALVASVLAYEVTAALFLVNAALLVYLVDLRQRGGWARGAFADAMAATANVLLLALAIGYKLTTTTRADVSGGYMRRVLRIVTEAAPVHFGELGLAMPMKVARALLDFPDARGMVATVLVTVLVGAYLLVALRAGRVQVDRGLGWPLVLLAGGVLFVAGYGVSLMTWEIGFHATGANNRTAIGAAIGVAWVFAGAIGWLCSTIPAGFARIAAFSGLMALLAGSSTLLTSTVGRFWVRAANEQQAIIGALTRRLPSLPSSTTVLLDGICPFEGPAPIFATDWDTRGMLQLVYGDSTLSGDVLKPSSRVLPEGIRTILFDDWIHTYPYGPRLLVFHVGQDEAFPLTDVRTATRYFEMVSAPATPECPAYTDGDGVPIF